MAPNLGNHWGRLIGATLVVLALGSFPPRWIQPPRLEENRVLAEAPDPSVALTDLKAFRKAVDAWVADRFPARPYLIGAANFALMHLGASGSKRVIVGRDGWLFYDDGSALGRTGADSPLTEAEKQLWLETLASRTATAKRYGAAYVMFVAPMKETVYPQFAPVWYRAPSSNRPAVVLPRLSTESGAGEVIYPHSELVRDAAWGLKVYSRHDTHWTALGAYQGYVQLMNRLQAQGLTEGPRPLTDFTEDSLAAAMRPRNLALMLGVDSFVAVDYPQLVDPATESALTVTYLTPKTDWTSSRVLDTGQTGKPVLLLTRDSFSNAFLPFLYSHFSRIVLTHGQDGQFRQDLIEQYHPDIVVHEVVEDGIFAAGVNPGGRAEPDARRRIEWALAVERRRQSVPARTATESGVREVGTGTDNPDAISGGPDRDLIVSRAGDDLIDAGGGGDIVHAGRGNDRVRGGDGNDWLSGDRGDDVLTGGRGQDVFHASPGAGVDRIMDFSAAQGDRVALDPGTEYQVRQQGADTVVELRGGRLILIGVALSSLPPHWISTQ